MRADLPWTSARLVVTDVEGNGRRPPSLVEVAVVSIEAGCVGEPASWLVRPPEAITWQATRVHGITNQDVAELPGIDAVAENIRAQLDGAVVVAHNAGIDLDVLTRDLPAGLRPHRAGYDALVTARLFVHLATDADGGPVLLGDLTGTRATGPQPDQLF